MIRRTALLLTGALSAFAAVDGPEAQVADTDGAAAAFADFDAACRATASRLWGPSLCGPIALVNRQTRAVVSNHALPAAGLQAAGRVWVGRLPDSILVANTSFRWHGTDFAMVILPLPAESFDRVALLAHESFHRIQKSMGLSALEQPSSHLDEQQARTWLRLELQALTYALTTQGAARRTHARNALAFRAERHRLYPAFAAREDSLEIQEGLAEYTGQVVAASSSNLGSLRHVRAIEGVTRRPSYVRSFAYATGPALGLVLDSLAPGWRSRVARERSLGRLLARAVGEPPSGSPVAVAAPYGHASISVSEEARAQERRARTAGYLRALVTGPVLRLPADQMMRSFDPNALFAMDTLGIAYPTGEFQGPWGKLVVEASSDGALLSSDYTLLRVAAPPSVEGRVLRGKGWVLTLGDGWLVRPAARTGDFEVGRQ